MARQGIPLFLAGMPHKLLLTYDYSICLVRDWICKWTMARPNVAIELWSTTSEAICPEWSGLGQDCQFHYCFAPASDSGSTRESQILHPGQSHKMLCFYIISSCLPVPTISNQSVSVAFLIFLRELSYSPACFWVCQMQVIVANSCYSKLRINSPFVLIGCPSLTPILDCFQRKIVFWVIRRGWESEPPSSSQVLVLVPLDISSREEVRDWEG